MLKRLIVFLLFALAVLLAACAKPGKRPEGTKPDAPPPPKHSAGLQMGVPIEAPGSVDEQKLQAEEFGETEYAVLDDRIIALFRSDATLQKRYLDTIQMLFSAVPETVNKYLILAPTRVEFEAEDIRACSDGQETAIFDLYFQIEQTAAPIDVHSALEAYAGPLDDIFYRLDDHWTALGGYYAAQAFFEAIHMPYHPIEEYERLAGSDFLGLLFVWRGEPEMRDCPDPLIYYLLPGQEKKETVYRPDESGTVRVTEEKIVDPKRGGYYTFIGFSSFSHAVLHGAPESDRVLMIVGDSSMCAFAPWMADSFKTVVLLDPRYFTSGLSGMQALLTEHRVTDFLILNDANTGLASSWYNTKFQGMAQ